MSALQSSLQGSNSKVIAGYALQQRLGSGSFATVYKGVRIATDDNDNSADVVAIKAITRLSDKLTKKVLENLEMEVRSIYCTRLNLTPNLA
jgi:serine/threonine-protein kinase ULK2